MPEDLEQVKRSISVEHFETFDPDTQLKIIKKLTTTVSMVKAAEQDFAPQQFEELRAYLESRQDELQIIYNIKSNKTLNDFWE